MSRRIEYTVTEADEQDVIADILNALSGVRTEYDVLLPQGEIERIFFINQTPKRNP